MTDIKGAELLAELRERTVPCLRTHCSAADPCDDCADVLGARALVAAERERCAKIADAVESESPSDYGLEEPEGWSGHRVSASTIADRIRSSE